MAYLCLDKLAIAPLVLGIPSVIIDHCGEKRFHKMCICAIRPRAENIGSQKRHTFT